MSVFFAYGIALAGTLIPTALALAQQPCTPLPPPSGATVQVTPAQASQLRSIVAAAESDTTILLEDGTYDLSQGDYSSRLTFENAGVTLRSLSGDRDTVILDAKYATNELVSIHASNVTIADLTLMRAYDHPIHISGGAGSPISGIMIHNLRIVDPGQQAIKVNPVDDGYIDDSTIECCSIELTDTGRTHIRDSCYTGGIDVHQASGWVVRRNRIEGFWCNDGLSEHGIHFWKCCRDTLIEENVIVDCARGIGFGLGSTGSCRTYPDDPYPGVGFKGHIDGIIRNNFVAASDTALQSSPAGFDTGVSLEQAYGARVVHNSVASTAAPASSSIEWRFSNSVIDLYNNLVTAGLLARDGAQSTSSGNIGSAPLSWFEDVTGGDLHVTQSATGAIDAGSVLESGLCEVDIDGLARDSSPDVGADELGPPPIFTDGFEAGDTRRWSATVPSI
jgi:hypothetical protein